MNFLTIEAMASFTGTVTSGIQDISSLLPLLGTEQVEKHVGSALEAGYMYAAVAPLSIFGSLGIVKAGTSVLAASTVFVRSLPIPSITFTPLPKISFRRLRRFVCGARILAHAGVEPIGKVSPMIGMDGNRYLAETRLTALLKNKHIDHPEKLTIEWRAREWNIGLICFSLLAAIVSVTPYIGLITYIDGPHSPSAPWVYPFLRSMGGLLTAVLSQFIIQQRILTIMKSRISFMVMDNRFGDSFKKLSEHSASEGEPSFRWTPNAPAEECLWGLGEYLLSQSTGHHQHPIVAKEAEVHSAVPISHSSDVSGADVSTRASSATPSGLSCNDSIPVSQVFYLPPTPRSEGTPTLAEHIISMTSEPQDILDEMGGAKEVLHQLAQEHKRHSTTPTFDWILLRCAQLFLFLSLPASIAGYIGCFMLVQSCRQTNGPLLWLGLECTLSLLRILIWALNPKFDELTDITVKITLDDLPPLVTTDQDVDILKSRRVLPLTPERTFLENITSYTGPLGEFSTTEHISLYFTLTGDRKRGQKVLFMTAVDWDKRTALTVFRDADRTCGLTLYDASPHTDPDTREMLATLEVELNDNHPRRRSLFFRRMAQHYTVLVQSLHRYHLIASSIPIVAQTVFKLRPLLSPGELANSGGIYESLTQSWSFANESDGDDSTISRSHTTLPLYPLPSLSSGDDQYLLQGYEHHLKAKFVDNLGQWIVHSMQAIRQNARNGCVYALADPASPNAKWELDELDFQLLGEQLKREVALLANSLVLESILYEKHGKCNRDIANAWDETSFVDKFMDECVVKMRKRLVAEQGQAKARLESAMRAASSVAEKEARAYGDPHYASLGRIWEQSLHFIATQWDEMIQIGPLLCLGVQDPTSGLGEVSDVIHQLNHRLQRFWNLFPIQERFWRPDRDDASLMGGIEFTKRLQSEGLNAQMDINRERVQGELTQVLEKIRCSSRPDDLEGAYGAYPTSSPELAAAIHSKCIRFSSIGPDLGSIAVRLGNCPTVYDFEDTDADISTVFSVIRQRGTRMVLNVPTRITKDPAFERAVENSYHVLSITSNMSLSDPVSHSLFRNTEYWKLLQQQEHSLLDHPLSSTFVLLPGPLADKAGQYIRKLTYPVGLIMLYMRQRGHIRLGLVHFATSGLEEAAAWLHVKGRKDSVNLLRIPSDTVPQKDLALQEFDVDQEFEEGYYELELHVWAVEYYCLRDVLVEFQPNRIETRKDSDTSGRQASVRLVES